MKNKVWISLLATSMLFTSCVFEPEETIYDVNVWTATGTEKLLRDVDYSARHSDTSLSIKAFKNEYESAQIVISTEGKYEYEILASDLKATNGDTLPASAFTLYHEKYINVMKIKDENSPTSVGYYPDALLPMAKAVEYEENFVSGKNQGIWVTLNVPKDQPAGEYCGEFELKVNGKTYDVPVNVTVYDYMLSDELHSKSSFAVGYEYLGYGELNTTIEMQEAYYEALLEYRLNGQHLPGNDMVYVKPEGEALERFLYYADKYTRDPRCSTFNLPFNLSEAKYNGKTIRSVHFEDFKTLLREMAKYSVENEINLFEKASTYFIFFDEYDLNGAEDEANYNLQKATDVCAEISAELAETLVCDDQEFLSEMLADIKGIKHKVVGNLTDALIVDEACCVPVVNKYHTEEGRALYENFAEKSYGEDAELWTYTCLSPRTPYPTYHIEDILLSSRLMGWMMYNYDIVGNLYWETALYSWRKEAFGDFPLQDYYDTALRYPGANGDGFLFYPGRDYGIFGPIGTIRLHSARDGNEDYDLLYALEEGYRNYGITEETFNELYSVMTQNLYTGTMVRIRDGLTEYFAETRALLANLLELTYNTGTVIKEIRAEKQSTIVTLESDANVTLTINGETKNGETVGARKSYTVNIPMSETVNYLNVTATKDGKTYGLKLNLGGKSVVVNASTFKTLANVLTGGEISVETIEEMSALKIAYNANDRLIAQVDVSSLGVNENTTQVAIYVYSYNDEQTELKILSKCERSMQYIEVESLNLVKGWNKIEIPATAFNCSNYGKLTTLRFNLTTTEATTIAVGDIEIGG